MQDLPAYEKLGAFYLGRRHDSETGKTSSVPLLYDAKDLVTHAVVLGMTGSGKTGLSISLLEEAAIDGIPALIIDPKGDLGNLMLNFPDLRPEDFRPWVQADDAARQGLTVDELAAKEAGKWKKGLESWDQGPDRLRRLRDAAEVKIYTPGSEAGEPISILSSFGAPPEVIREDGDLFQERIATSTSSLLALLGIDADPVKSREAILVSNVLQAEWSAGRDLDLAGLIQSVQNPPFERVGVLPLESFYPSGDRFELAMAINNLLASPSFAGWMRGAPLDVQSLLYTPEGKPRLAILSIAHLSDSERMFFVSLLLGEVLSWMRSRSGTTSLRALLYMDELFGYLPPVGNPPSKKPLLTLLKQARAFGLGLVLATQNPVDLDYKALSNIGTWFLGRLQTERDRKRLLDGLDTGEGGPSRREIEQLLSGLDKRIFLLHNVHEDGPVIFRSRWAMSYLRGPLTRDQIKTLHADAAQDAAVPPPAPAEAAAKVTPQAKTTKRAAGPPVLPPGVEQRFLSEGKTSEGEVGEAITWAPCLGMQAEVRFVDSRKGLEAGEKLVLAAVMPRGDRADWDAAERLDIEFTSLPEKADGGSFAVLPGDAGDPKNFKAWTKDAADWIYRTRRHALWKHGDFKLISEVGESEGDFRVRVQQRAHEERDLEIAKLRERYGKKIDTLEERIRRAAQKVTKEEEEAQAAKMQGVLEVGTSLLGALFGRKRVTTGIRSATRGWQRGRRESLDIDRAQEDHAELLEQLQELDRELQAEVDEVSLRFAAAHQGIETFELKPRKSDVDVRWLGIVWVGR